MRECFIFSKKKIHRDFFLNEILINIIFSQARKKMKELWHRRINFSQKNKIYPLK